jgi:hypothetical protein
MCHRELGPFLGESTLFLGEGALLPRELGPFPKENSLFVGEDFLTFVFFMQVFFKVLHLFLREFFYSLRTSFYSIANLCCSLGQFAWINT